MARKRMISPEFWTDEKVIELKPLCRLLFINCWNFADDEGILKNNAKQMKAHAFPADDISIDEVEEMKDQLIDVGFLVLGNNKELLKIRNWHSWQSIQKKQPSRYTFKADDNTTTVALQDNDSLIEKNRIEKKEKEIEPSLYISIWKIIYNRFGLQEMAYQAYTGLIKDAISRHGYENVITYCKRFLKDKDSEIKNIKYFLESGIDGYTTQVKGEGAKISELTCYDCENTWTRKINNIHEEKCPKCKEHTVMTLKEFEIEKGYKPGTYLHRFSEESQ